MANIPNQNNLIDVINSALEILEAVDKQVDDKQLKNADKKLKHIGTNLEAVVKFIEYTNKINGMVNSKITTGLVLFGRIKEFMDTYNDIIFTNNKISVRNLIGYKIRLLIMMSFANSIVKFIKIINSAPVVAVVKFRMFTWSLQTLVSSLETLNSIGRAGVLVKKLKAVKKSVVLLDEISGIVSSFNLANVIASIIWMSLANKMATGASNLVQTIAGIKLARILINILRIKLLGSLVKKVMRLINELNTIQIADLVRSISTIMFLNLNAKMLGMLVNTVNNLPNVKRSSFKKVKKIKKFVKKLYNSLFEIVSIGQQGFGKNVYWDAFKNLSISLGIVSGFIMQVVAFNLLTSGAILSMISMELAIVATGVFATTLIFVMGHIVKRIKKSQITTEELKDVTKNIVEAILALTAVMSTAKVVDFLTKGALKSLISMTIAIPVVFAFSVALLWFTEYLTENFTKESIKGVGESLKSIEKALAVVSTIMTSISVAQNLSGRGFVKAGVLFTMAMPIVVIALKGLMFAMAIIKRMPEPDKKQGKKIAKIVLLIGGIATIMLSITLTIPLILPAILGIIPLTVFMLMMVPFMLATALLIRVINIVSGGWRSLLVLFQINLLLTGLMFTALMIISLSLIAIAATKAIPSILLFLAGFLVIAAAFALLGVVLKFLLPFIVIAAIVVTIVCASVTFIAASLLLTASMLWLLSKIKLDRESILENVDMVLGLVGSIIQKIFGFDGNTNQKNQGFWKRLLGTLGIVGEAIAAMTVLAATVISVFCILLIAGMLILIGKINIKSIQKGEKVSKEVLAIANSVANSIFDSEGPKNKKDKNENRDKSFISFLGKSLMKIIGAILSVAYLAVTVVSILLILMIAGMLVGIGKFKFKKEEIQKKVTDILDIARSIVKTIFDPPTTGDENNKPSSNGWFTNLIAEWFPSVIPIMDAIMSVAYLAPIVCAVAIIWGIAFILQKINDIELDEASVNASVRRILNVADSITHTIFNSGTAEIPEETKEDKSWIAKAVDAVCDFVGGAWDKIKAVATWIWKMGKLGAVLIAVGLLYLITKALNSISEANIDSGIQSKVRLIITTAGDVATTIMNSDSLKKINKDTINTAKKNLDAIADYVKGLKKVYDVVNEVSAARVDTSALGLVKELNTTLGSISKITPEDISNVDRLADKYIKFLEKIDTMDLRKLNIGEKIIENFANMTSKLKGDFGSLATALTDHMAPMIKKLQVTLEEASKTQKEIMMELASPIDINIGDSPISSGGSFGGGGGSFGSTSSPDNSITESADPAGGLPSKNPSTMFGSFNNSQLSGKYKLTVNIIDAQKA